MGKQRLWVTLPASPRAGAVPSPYQVRTVETDQPGAVRGVQRQRIDEPVRPFWSHLRSQHHELYPVSDLVHERRLAVKVEQCIESGVAVRRRH